MTTAIRPATCEAIVAHHVGLYGEVPVYCGQSVGLVAIHAPDGTVRRACSRFGHVDQVAAKVARTAPTTRCRCGSPLTPKGCINADCGNWEGPFA